MSRYQLLALLTGIAIFILGVFLFSKTHHPSDLHYTGISFLFVGPAIFTVALMSWLSDRYDKLALLVGGLILGGLLFSIGVICALASYLY